MRCKVNKSSCEGTQPALNGAEFKRVVSRRQEYLDELRDFKIWPVDEDNNG